MIINWSLTLALETLFPPRLSLWRIRAYQVADPTAWVAHLFRNIQLCHELYTDLHLESLNCFDSEQAGSKKERRKSNNNSSSNSQRTRKWLWSWIHRVVNTAAQWVMKATYIQIFMLQHLQTHGSIKPATKRSLGQPCQYRILICHLHQHQWIQLVIIHKILTPEQWQCHKKFHVRYNTRINSHNSRLHQQQGQPILHLIHRWTTRNPYTNSKLNSSSAKALTCKSSLKLGRHD